MADPVDVVRDAPAMPLAPVDPNVHMPASAQRAAALAESFYQKSLDEAAPPAPSKEQGSAPLPSPTDAPPLQPEQPADAEPPPTPDYEHMYKSMKGRFDQQHTINAQLAEELRQQQIFNQRLREEREQAAKPPPAPKQLLTEEERQAYGDDFLNIVGKRVQEVVGDQLSVLEQIKQDNARLQQQVARQENRTLAQLVTAQVPNWRELNADSQFLHWLSLRDVYSGVSRNELLQRATRRSDAPAIIAFYKGYLAETGQLQPQTAETAHPAPSRQPAVNLEQLVAPGAPRPATVRPDLAQQKRTYSRKDISTYFDQKRRGLWAGRDQEALALEREFTAAATEGRIV